jgi:hypothetical protein
MKQITLNVPDDVTVLEAQNKLDLALSPDWISLQWHISDVQGCVGDDYAPMSDEDARDILAEMEHRHDCNNGVSWDTINHHVDIWRERLEEDAFQSLKAQREARILEEEV